jgi:hypothetical protein
MITVIGWHILLASQPIHSLLLAEKPEGSGELRSHENLQVYL